MSRLRGSVRVVLACTLNLRYPICLVEAAGSGTWNACASGSLHLHHPRIPSGGVASQGRPTAHPRGLSESAAQRPRWPVGCRASGRTSGQRLHAVHQARARTGEGGVGVHGPHRDAGPAARPRRPACAPAPSTGAGRSRTARTRRGPARPRVPASQVTRTDFSPARPIVGTPPAAVTISGTQWPGAKGGSVHSSSSTRGAAPVPAPRPARATVSSRARSEPTSVCLGLVAGGRPEHADRAEHLRRGCAGRWSAPRRCSPRWASASSTTETSTAQTAHRSWVTTRSASRPLSAPSSRW